MLIEENPEQAKLIFHLELRQQMFLSKVNEQSQITHLLQDIDFSAFHTFYLHLKENEEIDDINFDKISILFENLQYQKGQGIKKFGIISEKCNYLSPKSYQRIIQPFYRNIEELHIQIYDTLDKSVTDWLKPISQILSDHSFKAFKVEIKKKYALSLFANKLTITLNTSQQMSEELFLYIAKIVATQRFSSFKLIIGDDNTILGFFSLIQQALKQKNGELESLSIVVGQACQLESKSIESLLETLAAQNQLKKLTLRIGSSNQVTSNIFISIFEAIRKSLTKLTLEIGNNVKLFQKLIQLQQIDVHQLEKLVFKVGKMNNFQCQGALILSQLVNSIKLRIVSIKIGDFNKMSELQSLQVILTLQQLRGLNSLELFYEREISINNFAIQELNKVIQNNKNINRFSLSIAKQQNDLDFKQSLLLLLNNQNMHYLDLSFGGSIKLPNWNLFIQQGTTSSKIKIFKLNLRGNNGLHYQSLKQFIKYLKHTSQLTLMEIKINQQLMSEHSEKEIIENNDIMISVCSSGIPIFQSYSYLNNEICFHYNFDQLIFVGYLFQNLAENVHFFPHPQNNLSITVKTTKDQTALYPLFIQNVNQLIANQENIIIQTPQLTYKRQLQCNSLQCQNFNDLQVFAQSHDQVINNINYQSQDLVEQPTLLQIVNFLLSKYQFNNNEQFSNDINYQIGQLILQYNSRNLNYQFISQQQGNGFFNQYTELLSFFQQQECLSVRLATILQNQNVDWKQLNYLSQMQNIVSLELDFQTQQFDSTVQNYHSFFLTLSKILANNQYLTHLNFAKIEKYFPLQFLNIYKNQIQEMKNRINQQNQQANNQQQQAQQLLNDDDEEDDDDNQQPQQLNEEELAQLKRQVDLNEFTLNSSLILRNAIKKVINQRQKQLYIQYCLQVQKLFNNRGFRDQVIYDLIEMFV